MMIHVQPLSMKQVCETRLEAIISLIMHVKDFSFLTCLIVWHYILFQVNFVSKTLQAKMTDLTSAMRVLDACQAFLASFREKLLVGAIISAKEIADQKIGEEKAIFV